MRKKAIPASGKEPIGEADKATSKRGAKPCIPVLIAQGGGQEYDITDIVERAKADYKATHKVGIHSCKVYIKADDGMAYYVINQTEGKFSL